MTWNTFEIPQAQPLYKNMQEVQQRLYFVHSYHVQCCKTENILTKKKFGYEFTSSIINGNIHGVQFHPEKTHSFGLNLIKNFIEKC